MPETGVPDNELGSFLRARRESITPVEVGLPSGGRRRTPGLRRSELATIAGVSVDYLIRLEQGRDRNPSGAIIAALAEALRLSEEERHHLKRLAAFTSSPELCPGPAPLATTVRSSVQAILDRLEPAPAVVINALGDLVAWTAGYEPIGGPLGILDTATPNFARYTFCDPRARDHYPDWSRVADQQVANLRSVLNCASSAYDALLNDLHERGGDEFERRWKARPVARKTTGVKRLTHPDVGELKLCFETLTLGVDDGQQLVVYLPEDQATAGALDRLAGRYPGGLRAVPSRAHPA